MDEQGVNVHAILQIVLFCLALAACGRAIALADASGPPGQEMCSAVELSGHA